MKSINTERIEIFAPIVNWQNYVQEEQQKWTLLKRTTHTQRSEDKAIGYKNSVKEWNELITL